MSRMVLGTERLVLRRLSTDDAGFLLELLNDPIFIRNIGDREVRTIAECERYILDGPVASYSHHGFGLYRMELRADGDPIGICGLLKRDSLPDVDVGFALLPRFRSQGYAFEAVAAVLAHARHVHGMGRIVAIVTPGNDASVRVLTKAGLRFERPFRLADDGPELALYA